MPDESYYLEPTVYGGLADAREREEGRNGSGYMTAEELARYIRARKFDVLRCLEAAPALFRELRREQAKALGASPKARLFGLAEWPDVHAEELKHYLVSPEHRAAYEAAQARARHSS